MNPYEELWRDVDIAAEGAIESFVDEFHRHYGLYSNEPPEGMEWETWYELLGLNAAAESLVAAALHLYRPERLTRREINLPQQLEAAAEAEHEGLEDLLRQLKDLGGPDQQWDAIEGFLRAHLPDPESFKKRFFLSAVQVALASEHAVLPTINETAHNLLALVQFLTREQDPTVRDYMERVARCYLFDMVPELCLMSRAVLEAALENRLPVAYMRKVHGLRSNERVALSAWIAEALSSGLFDDSIGAAARRLAKLGGDVAHGKPLPNTDPDQVLSDLHSAVTALERPRSRGT